MACLDPDQCVILSQLDTDVLALKTEVVLTNAVLSAMIVLSVLYLIAKYVIRFFDDAL